MTGFEGPYVSRGFDSGLDQARTENHLGVRAIREAFSRAEPVMPPNDPITPLGHNLGDYYLIAPSGQMRKFSGEALENGRGVKALLVGQGPEVEDWCHSLFSTSKGKWDPKVAGLWIIEKCNQKGVFDPDRVELRSIGVWRDHAGQAVAHCGNRLVLPCGDVLPLHHPSGPAVMLGAAPIVGPSFQQIRPADRRDLLHRLRRQWGWSNAYDADIFLGWVAAAALGGFPDWRSHLYVDGNRGCGKSRLLETAAALLGDLAGDVFNDATEAGLRQSRNNQARPLLIDEFEPDDNPRNANKQGSMLALFRRMSGGKGGRISRGGSDHASKTFRLSGPVYLSSINHIQFEPQDVSRIVVLNLQPIPKNEVNMDGASNLVALLESCQKLSPMFLGRMLAQSERWDRTHAAIAAMAREMGADSRQADTASTILAGLDLFLFDGEADDLRLKDLQEPLATLIPGMDGDEELADGTDVIDYLLSAMLSLDHGLKRTVGELLHAVYGESGLSDSIDPRAALARHGIFADPNKGFFAVRSSTTSALSQLFERSKWAKGAHVSALRKVTGVTKPKSAKRHGKNGQLRVLEIPVSLISNDESSN